MNQTCLRVLDIVPGTSVDGPGLRTSIYFAGCNHRCEGCHNPQSWDFEGGKLMTIEQIVAVVEQEGFNVTFSGGDPLYQLPVLKVLAKALKARGYNIWCYTGFVFEELAADERYSELLQQLDVVVDGPFVMSQRDIALRFRGSSNQRLIDVKKSVKEGKTIVWHDNIAIC
jgi:anaerobic ribonucleoside-triphosphate reductase activating protein